MQDPPPTRRCFIDIATSHGLKGWAVGSRPEVPCHLRFEIDGRVVARAVARTFRRDLLEAGIGHGHYGFSARYAFPLPLGETMFTVFEEGVPDLLPGNGMDVIALAPEPPEPPMPVEELLEHVDHWTPQDMRHHVHLLRLDANMAAMGIARFVDVTFKYVLARWADPGGARGYELALREGRITPDGFFLELLTSEERRNVHGPLVSPYNSQFPYDIA